MQKNSHHVKFHGKCRCTDDFRIGVVSVCWVTEADIWGRLDMQKTNYRVECSRTHFRVDVRCVAEAADIRDRVVSPSGPLFMAV